MKIKNVQEKDDLQLHNKKTKLKEKGITLIALVVTIIILLILAGVTLAMALSGDGLFNRAKKATDDYEITSESEALSMYLLSSKLDNEDIALGEPLYDKNLYNGDKWNIVFTDNEKYGTGWNYIAKGTNIEGYGKINNSFVINTKTKEIIELEEGKYDKLNYKDSVAITNNLALNIDASNLEDNNWEGITKHGNIEYDNVRKGILFKEDGNYLELNKTVSFKDGFTFEIFMNLNTTGSSIYNDGKRARNFLQDTLFGSSISLCYEIWNV